MIRISLLLFVVCSLALVKVSYPCALPYWWMEAYALSNKTQMLISDPGRSFHYRESFQVFDQNNFFHIKEYSWWEHEASSNDNTVQNAVKTPGVKMPGFFGVIPGTVTDIHKKTGVKMPGLFGKMPGTVSNIPDTPPKIPKTPPMIPETPSMIPETPPMISENPPMIPETVPEMVSEEPIIPHVVTISGANPEVERNENESADPPPLEDLQEGGNDLLQAEENSQITPTLFPSWFRKKTVNETRPCEPSAADIQSLRNMIEKMFSSPRDHSQHPENKEKARKDILNKFRSFGLQVWTQNFTIPTLSASMGDDSMTGKNLVGVIPGLQRGQLNDGIVLVGAHYDTVANSNGVDDNGSGLAVMLEIAKMLSAARCRLNNTLMFVAFDMEEDGAVGSNAFVEQYLIPEELKRARAHFQGAFILDGVLNFNSAPNTQQLPRDFAESLPGLQSFINFTGNRGDFLAMISRNSLDNHLTTKLMESWQKLQDQNYKLFNLAVDMGNKIPSPSVLENHLNFLSSDHSAFWYHNASSMFPETLNAVLLTDTGPFRGQMQKCYHSECDDLSNMSPEKLQFAKKTADALTATLVELTRATAAGNWLRGDSTILILLVISVLVSAKYIR